MTAAQPTIIATSIGFRGSAGNPGGLTAGPAYVHAARLARAGTAPRLCIIGTALGDNPAHLAGFYSAFGRLGMNVTHLALFPMPNVPDVAEHLGSQDIIWVAGGSTANLLALWRLHGLDKILAGCWAAGVVLMGVSAGSICWNIGGTTDSFGPELRPVTNALGFLPYSNNPHYDAEEQRRPLAQRLVAVGTLPDGFATANGAGLVFYGTDLHEAIAEDQGALAYSLSRTADGEVTEIALPTRVL
ncbi:MAG: Type 1 glutamine amidotransferase-like domain-containing protein [Streptosporangiaceae bacterium]